VDAAGEAEVGANVRQVGGDSAVADEEVGRDLAVADMLVPPRITLEAVAGPDGRIESEPSPSSSPPCSPQVTRRGGGPPHRELDGRAQVANLDQTDQRLWMIRSDADVH
jgi:hypothetical protein